MYPFFLQAEDGIRYTSVTGVQTCALLLAVAGAGDGAAAAAVVDECVDRLLEHPLLVAHDDLGRAELEQPLQAVVAVDHAAVEVVEVGGGEAAAVQLDHRAQLWRNDRQDIEHHP